MRRRTRKQSPEFHALIGAWATHLMREHPDMELPIVYLYAADCARIAANH